MEEHNYGVKQRLLRFIGHLGMSVRSFETRCGMAYGYVANISKGIGAEKMRSILNAFPQLNSDWLLTGEGEMLRPAVTQIGDGNNNQQGDGNVYNCDQKAYDAIMRVVEDNHKISEKFMAMLAKSQDQIDRLISLLEKK